jgi:hypothetical protein
MMDVANIHASCVMLANAAPVSSGLFHAGVLLLGDSGAGKSDLALRVIAQGGMLVADDRAELFVENGSLKVQPPAALAGLIEVRGVGILALSYEKTAAIALVVQLATPDSVPRLPEPARYAPPAPLVLPDNLRPPLIQLNPFEASAVAKLCWAVMAFRQNLFREAPNQ